MTRIRLLAVALAMGAVACSTTPSSEEIASHDYGPFPSNYEQLIKDHIGKTFFDPYSVRDLAISEPKKGYYNHGLGRQTLGWYSVVTLNAKNRMGGYVGHTTYHCVIDQGVVVTWAKARPAGW